MVIELLIRELVMLALVGAAGAGFVVMLADEDRPGSRMALAFGAGLVVLVGPLILIDFFVPLGDALWFFALPCCCLSLWWAARRARVSRLRWPLRTELVAIGVVLVAVLALGNVAMVQRDTLGPIGYGIFDGPGYVSEIEGFKTQTDKHPALRAVPSDWQGHEWDRYAWGAPWNLALRYGWAFKAQHTASTAIPATASGAFGWPSWTLVVPFMVVLLCLGALGTLALARSVADLPPWLAAIAGVLYAGPLTYQIFVDGSLGLLAGLAVLPLLLICVAAAIRRPGVRVAALAGACLGALSAIYPEQLAAVLLGCGLWGFVAAVVHVRRHGRPQRHEIASILRLLGIVLLAGLLISPRTIPWTYDYLVNQAAGDVRGLVSYPHMTLRYIPGWLAQTRAFYDFFFVTPSGAGEVIAAIVIPLALLVPIAVGVVRRTETRILLALAAAAAAQAAIASARYSCSYCVQRSLLLLSPVVPVLIVAGFGALVVLRRRGGRELAVAGLLGYLVAVGIAMHSSVHRTVVGAVTWPAYMRDVAAAVAHHSSGGIALEGFGAEPYAAWLEYPAAYAVVSEASPQRISTVAAYDDYGGVSYLGPRALGDPAWNPDYQWVLTRLGGVDQGRRVVFRRGPYALERRAFPFDVIVARGVAVDTPSRDPRGFAWVQTPSSQLGLVQGPLTLWIAADRPGTAYVRVALTGPPNLGVAMRPGLIQHRPHPGVLDLCEAVPGPASPRIVSYAVGPPTGFLTASGNTLDPRPEPVRTIRLARVTASTVPCSAAVR